MSVTTQDHARPEIGIEVYIGRMPREYEKKVLWTVKHIDELGNVKLVANHNPNIRRNFPNVDILVGKLFRRDGKVIQGQVNERKPLPREGRRLTVKDLRRSR